MSFLLTSAVCSGNFLAQNKLGISAWWFKLKIIVKTFPQIETESSKTIAIIQEYKGNTIRVKISADFDLNVNANANLYQLHDLAKFKIDLKFCKIMIKPESGNISASRQIEISADFSFDIHCWPVWYKILPLGVHEQHQHNGCQWIAISADFSTDLRWPVWYKLLPRSARATSVAANESRSALTSTSESNVRSTRAASVAASSDSFAVKFWKIHLMPANLLT